MDDLLTFRHFSKKNLADVDDVSTFTDTTFNFVDCGQADLDVSRATGATEVSEDVESSLKKVHQLTGTVATKSIGRGLS